MVQQSPAVLSEITGATAIIRFNRAAERNPLSRSTLHELQQILERIIIRDDLKTIVFTGTADIFLSGANIRELAELDLQTALKFAEFGQRIFQNISDARQLTIAAINGYCMGGGLDLALACDLRVAVGSAVFAHPGAKLGIITGWGGTQRLPRIVGKSAALEMLLTARRVSATEALTIGLVTEVSDDPLAHALEIARACERGGLENRSGG